MKKSLDQILREMQQREMERERGTWKQELRRRYEPWFQDLTYGFEFKEGWSAIFGKAMERLADLFGDPLDCPELRITHAREEAGSLTVQVAGVPAERRSAVNEILRAASECSLRTCERCGRPGSLRESGRSHRHTACDEHVAGEHEVDENAAAG